MSARRMFGRLHFGVLAGLVAALGLAVGGGHAQAKNKKSDFIPDAILLKKKSKKKKKPKQGWQATLNMGLNFAFASSQGVVGIPDGTTVSVGLNLDGSVRFLKGPHSWVTTLKILHTQTKLATIEPFIKAADQFAVTTEYAYRFRKLKWLSVFGGLRLTTSLLPGNLIQNADKDLVLQLTDGTTRVETVPAHSKFRLTNSFAPALFKQFAGVAFRPLDEKKIRIDVRVGGGAVEVFTQGGLVAADDKATPLFELNQLRDYVQGGAELQLAVAGVLFKKILSYSLSGEILLPFGTSISTSLPFGDQINVELGARLAIKVFTWLTVNYTLSVLRVPLIQRDWQVTNNLMLSLTVDILK